MVFALQEQAIELGTKGGGEDEKGEEEHDACPMTSQAEIKDEDRMRECSNDGINPKSTKKEMFLHVTISFPEEKVGKLQ